MYGGVPSAEPVCVSADPPAEEGRSVASEASLRAPSAGRRLGQAPVDDQRLAVLAEHDVARLQVAVQHAPAVGIGDRVADVDEPPEELRARPGSARRGRGRGLSARWNRSMASLRLSPRMNRMA